MKKIFFAASLLSCAVCSSAFAQSSTKSAQDQSWKAPVSTLTRAQVERSLVHAEKDGQLSYLDTVVYRGSR